MSFLCLYSRVFGGVNFAEIDTRIGLCAGPDAKIKITRPFGAPKFANVAPSETQSERKGIRSRDQLVIGSVRHCEIAIVNCKNRSDLPKIIRRCP